MFVDFSFEKKPNHVRIVLFYESNTRARGWVQLSVVQRSAFVVGPTETNRDLGITQVPSG